jgi:uncharacterized membrane protein SpoIIM required for sporulation
MIPLSWRCLLTAGVFGVGCALAFSLPHATIPLSQVPYVDRAEAQIPTVAFILRTNVAAQLLMLSGLVTGGSSTLILTLMNGVSFGGILKGFLVSGYGASAVLVAVGPHALPELLGFFLSGAVGLGGFELLRNLILGHSQPLRPPLLAEGRTAMIALLLTVCAAIIEGSITNRLVNYYINK